MDLKSKITIKRLICVALLFCGAAHSFARLDPISTDRVDKYLQSNLLVESLNKEALHSLWFNQEDKTWKHGSNTVLDAIYDRFANLTYEECRDWNYKDSDSQLFLYWMNDVALVRKNGKLTNEEALKLLESVVNTGYGTNYGDLWIPLEAVLNIGNFTCPKTITTATREGMNTWNDKHYDFAGVDLSRFSDENWIKFSNAYCQGAPENPRGYINPFECFKNLNMDDFFSGKFRLSGSYDLSGFTSDQISNADRKIFSSLSGIKLDPTKSLYDSQGNYIFDGMTVRGMDFRGFPEMNVELLKRTAYYNCQLPAITLSSSDDLSGVNLSVCDFRYVKGLTQEHLNQIGIAKLELLMFSRAQYNQHIGFFTENAKTIKRIYIDGSILWLYKG